ncbi:MAG: hypothetical protein ACR5K5_04425 [Wolbachia sp.]
MQVAALKSPKKDDVIPVLLFLSSQCLTLGSSSYCTFTWCRVKFSGSQCQLLG